MIAFTGTILNTNVRQHILKALIICTGILFMLPFQADLSADITTEERFGISFPKLSPVTLPEVTEYKLKNGMIFLLSEDNTFPTVSIDLRNDAGSSFDKPGKIGTSSLTAQLLRSGGTGNYTPTELNNLLDNRAMRLSINSRLLSSSIYMDFLSEDTELAMEILNEVLRNPKFDENSIETAKRGMNASISRRNDEINSIAVREFHNLVIGRESPLSRYSEYDDIRNVSREDLVNFHKQHYHPNNTYVSIVGDFDTKEMKKLVNKTFGNWKAVKNPLEFVHDEEVVFEASVNHVSRPEADQTWIIIGHRAEMTQINPDYIPMIILNDILGSGFTSRINRRLRRQLGLAYAPGAYYTVQYNLYGFFYLMSQTRTDKTVEAIEALIDEVRILQNEPVTEEELHSAKESYLNSFVFNYDVTWRILNRQMNFMRFGYPDNFLEQVRDRVYDVTVEDIQRVAKTYLRPDDFVILAVGNESEFDRPLSDLGPVNNIDITIPPPTIDAQDVTKSQIDEGAEIFQLYRKAAGLDQEIKSIELTSIATQYNEGDSSRVHMKTYMTFPDKFTQNIATPRGDLEMIYNQGRTRMRTPAGNMALPAPFKDRIESELKSNPVGLANYYIDEFELSLLKEVHIDGRDCYVLSLSDDKRSFLLFIDKKDMLPYQSVYDDFATMSTMYIRFSDYHKVNGIQYPMTIITKDESGTVLSRALYTDVKVNPDIPETVFSTE